MKKKAKSTYDEFIEDDEQKDYKSFLIFNQKGYSYQYQFNLLNFLNINIEKLNLIWELFLFFEKCNLKQGEKISDDTKKSIIKQFNKNIILKEINLSDDKKNLYVFTAKEGGKNCNLDETINRIYIFVIDFIEDIINQLYKIKITYDGIKFKGIFETMRS